MSQEAVVPIDRRDTMRLMAGLLGGAMGVQDATKPLQGEHIFGGQISDSDSAVYVEENVLIAEDYDAASDALSRTPTLAFTTAGNSYIFGSEAFSFNMSDVTFIANLESYEEAKAEVDRYPTVAITETGVYTFTGGA